MGLTSISDLGQNVLESSEPGRQARNTLNPRDSSLSSDVGMLPHPLFTLENVDYSGRC